MDIDLETKNKVKQYLFIDETEHENLSQVNSNLTTVYSLNNLTGASKKIELKQLFSNSKNELIQLISGLLNENLVKVKNEVHNYINSSLKEKIDLVISDLTILNFKGNVEELPKECKIGDIYCLLKENNGKEYYICIENNKLQRILIDIDTEYFIENYYKKNDIDQILVNLENEFNEKVNQLQTLIADTLTRNEFESLNLKYQKKIDELSGLIQNYFL